MKKITTLLAVLCIIGLLAGCGAKAPAATPEPTPDPTPTFSYNKSQRMPSDYSDAELSEDVLIHYDAEGAINGQGEISLRYENTSDKDYTYTALQRLEVLLDDGWYMVPDAQDFVTMQLFTVPANSSVEQDFRFEERYEPLLPGTFRILKSFTDADGNQAVAWLEFVIE